MSDSVPPISTRPLEDPPGERRYHASFLGTAGEFFEISVINWILSAVTLGIYAAWARIRVFKFFYESTELHKDRFDFTATGWQLFKGYLLAALVFGGFNLVLQVGNILYPESAGLLGFVGIANAVVLLWLFHYAYFRSRRFRFAHTRYRGIRFYLEGAASDFAWQAYWRFWLSLLTAFVFYPVYLHYFKRQIYNNLYYGKTKFRYTGKDEEYWILCLVGAIFTVLTLGVYFFYFMPKLYMYFVDHLYVGESRVTTQRIGAGEFFGLVVPNFLIIVFTLGIGTPVAQVRSARFFIDRIRIEGGLDLDEIVQNEREITGAFGEGMAEELDVDVDLGF